MIPLLGNAPGIVLYSVRFNSLLFLLLLWFQFSLSASSQRTAIFAETAEGTNQLKGRYSFADLFEVGKILFAKEEYNKAQEVLELALKLQPQNLDVFRILAEIYEKTAQRDNLSRLADVVSSYLLPEGEEDDFYEKMLTMAISLNSRIDPENAWKIFQRLRISLLRTPGKFHQLIKELETSVYVPFLTRMYSFLQRNSDYEDFLWGRLGEFYLDKAEYDKAKTFFELEFERRNFERRFLYSYALIVMKSRDYALCQIWVNVARKLNTEPQVLEKIAELQRVLGEHLYDVGVEQIHKEADLLFRFAEKELGLQRLKELLLLSSVNPQAYFQMGKMLLSYPEEYDTWLEGRDYFLQYLQLAEHISFSDYLKICELFFRRNFLNEMAMILRRIKADFPHQYEQAGELRAFREKVQNQLLSQIQLFDNYASSDELKRYLYFLLEFSPESISAWIRLAELYETLLIEQKKQRQSLSKELIIEVQEFVEKIEIQAINIAPDSKELYYQAGNLLSRLSGIRQYSREIAHFRKALLLDESYIEAGIALGSAYYDFEFYRQSIMQLQKIEQYLQKDDQLFKARIQELLVNNFLKGAEIAYGHGNYFLVIENMMAAIARNNGALIDKESSIWLAYAYANTENHRANEEFLELALAAYGQEIQLQYLQAAAKTGLLKYKEAVQIYSDILKNNQDEDNFFVKECSKNKENLELLLQYQEEQKKD